MTTDQTSEQTFPLSDPTAPSDPPAHTGGCLCGAVRYAIAGPIAMQMVCHCTNCQKQGGSAFSVLIGVPEDSVTMTGTLSAYADAGDSGAPVIRKFCGTCGSPILSEIAAATGMTFIKAGTLDDASVLAPTMHLWTRSKMAWVETGAALCIETQPGQG